MVVEGNNWEPHWVPCLESGAGDDELELWMNTFRVKLVVRHIIFKVIRDLLTRLFSQWPKMAQSSGQTIIEAKSE